MAAATLLTSQRPFPLHKFNEIGIVSHPIQRTHSSKTTIYSIFKNNKAMAASLLGAAGFALTLVVEPASAAKLMMGSSSLPLYEPPNALSLPTWAIHVSSVVEWYRSMGLATVQSKEQIVRMKVMKEMNRSGVEAMRSKMGMKSNVIRNLPKNVTY